MSTTNSHLSTEHQSLNNFTNSLTILNLTFRGRNGFDWIHNAVGAEQRLLSPVFTGTASIPQHGARQPSPNKQGARNNFTNSLTLELSPHISRKYYFLLIECYKGLYRFASISKVLTYHDLISQILSPHFTNSLTLRACNFTNSLTLLHKFSHLTTCKMLIIRCNTAPKLLKDA